MNAPAPEVTEEVTVPQPAEATPSSLFKYAIWVHVGPGAEDCSEVDEQAGTCHCPDSGHFHAWCRIPNQFQERDIRERASAARARKMRQLRTDGSDSNVILEGALDALMAEPDGPARMSEELVGNDWAEDYLTALRIVRETEDEKDDSEESTKLFEHIEDDQARYAQLQALPEDERPSDEFEELGQHLQAYEKAAAEQFEAIRNPKLESYLSMAETDLLDLVRRKRIERLGQDEFMHHFNAHEWLSCAYRDRGGEPFFRDIEQLRGADSDVLAALAETFADLERTAREAQGN